MYVYRDLEKIGIKSLHVDGKKIEEKNGIFAAQVEIGKPVDISIEFVGALSKITLWGNGISENAPKIGTGLSIFENLPINAVGDTEYRFKVAASDIINTKNSKNYRFILHKNSPYLGKIGRAHV